MCGFEDGRVRADVRAGRHSEAADEAGREVADDVAVEVGQDEDVELLGALDELHRECVDEYLPGLDVRIPGRDLTEDGEEEPVGELHDVRLGHTGDLATPMLPRVLEGVADDPLGRLRADRLHRDSRARGDLPRLKRVERLDHATGRLRAGFVLDAGVEVLGVLPHDDEIDVLVARAHARVRLARPKACIELELVAKCDVHGAEAGADRRRDRPLQRDAVRLHRLERLLGEGRACLLHHVDARLADVPVEVDTRRLEDASGCVGELWPGPVAGDEGDAMGHRRGRSYLHACGIPLR